MGSIVAINNCDDEKKNKTGRCESIWNYIDKANFGNHKKITANLLRTFAENLHFLKKETDKLKDFTDPENKMYFNPFDINERQSWGVVRNNSDGGKTCIFDDSRKFTGSTAFKNYNTIDKDNTTAYIDTVNSCATLEPKVQDVVTTTECQGPNVGGLAGCNAHWYISFNRNKTYNPSNEFKQNLDSTDIPSISRKQTFKPKTSGKLESITLNLVGTPDAEYPLIIQVFDEENESGIPEEIARTEFKFENLSGGGLTALSFEQAPLVEKGHLYSFVLRSPLTSYKNHYGVGGWGKTCNIDPYPEGECFLSENNASKLGTWIRHGRSEKTLSYHNGSTQPIDFGFQCAIRPVEPIYETEKEFVVYFKTVQMNPCTFLDLKHEDNANGNSDISIVYEVTNNGKDWIKLDNTNHYSTRFDTPTMFITLRATLKTTNQYKTPRIDYLGIICDTEPAKSAYLRTNPYAPEISSILGASVWSGVRAPYFFKPYEKAVNTNNEQQVKVEVDIVRNTTIIDRWKLVSYKNIIPYIKEYYLEYYMSIDKYSTNEKNNDGTITLQHEQELNNLIVNLESDDGKVKEELEKDISQEDIGYLTVLDWIHDKRRVYLVDEMNSFELSEFPAYPLLHVELTKNNAIETDNNTLISDTTDTENTVESAYNTYKEWVDFEVGDDGTYNTNVVYFGSSDYPTTLEEGDLQIEYNPIWIQGLTEKDFLEVINDDFNYDIDSELWDESFVERYKEQLIPKTFKMDLFEEEFIYDGESKLFNLKVPPMNAVREVTVDNNVTTRTLIENVNFSIDYDAKLFNINDDLDLGDIINIKYTPYLTDGSLSLAYRLERGDVNAQVQLEPYCFSYRV